MEPEGSLPHLQVPCHRDMACPHVVDEGMTSIEEGSYEYIA